MKLPALWIAAAFAAGIAALAPEFATPLPLLALVISALLAALLLLWRGRLTAAWIVALAGWCFLGGLAAKLDERAIPARHVTQLLLAGQLETSEPLRWRGRLRYDPLRLPWGLRFEVALEEVEIAGRAAEAEGGLRVNYFFTGRGDEAPPPLRAGDRVEALLQARPPRNFRNPGAFDARAHLARQGVHLTGSLRSLELLRKVDEPPPALAHRLAQLRGRLLETLDELFAASPGRAAVLRAMLLGDRNFIDHELAEAFQRTAVYHVLVVSGLHVAALAAFLFWTGRRLRLSEALTVLLTLAVLIFFVAVVEDRPPIQRAALMAGVYLVARLLFRRVELLNTVAVAALVILVANPDALADPGFQLSFLAAGLIGALALPWIALTSEPYRRALAHISDVTRDASHPPRATQFRLDLRAASSWLAARLPARLSARAAGVLTAPISLILRLWEVFLVSVAIQLGILPLIAFYFHRVTLAGPLVNIPAALLAGLIVPVGYLTLAAESVWHSLGVISATALDALVAALLATVSWFSEWSRASYRIPGPPAWLLAVFFLTLVLFCMAARSAAANSDRRGGRLLHWVAAAPLAVLAVLVAVHPFAPQLEQGQMEVTVLDVSQGDSLFVAFPDGRTMLIDGGGLFGAGRQGGYRTGLDIGEQVVSPYLWRRGLQRLDVVALTHAHHDHMNGLHAILENFEVKELWVGRDVDVPAFRELLAQAVARGVAVRHRTRGESFEWGGVTGIILWPEDTAQADAAANNDSLVLHLEHGSVKLLLPGDIERQVERELVARDDPLDTDFLKVPHHGSRSSATPDFLARTTPRVAVISLAENNPFNHPHPEVLERLSKAGVRILRTDRDGAVTALSDGRTLRVTSFAGGNPR